MGIFNKDTQKSAELLEKEKELETLLTITEEEKIEELATKVEETKIIKSMKKLMDLTGESGLDGLCSISDDVTEIADDEEISVILDEVLQKGENLTYVKAAINIAKLVSLIIKNHRDELVRILSVLTGKPADEVMKFRVGLLVAMTKKAILQDENMLNLFKR